MLVFHSLVSAAHSVSFASVVTVRSLVDSASVGWWVAERREIGQEQRLREDLGKN